MILYNYSQCEDTISISGDAATVGFSCSGVFGFLNERKLNTSNPLLLSSSLFFFFHIWSVASRVVYADMGICMVLTGAFFASIGFAFSVGFSGDAGTPLSS